MAREKAPLDVDAVSMTSAHQQKKRPSARPRHPATLLLLILLPVIYILQWNGFTSDLVADLLPSTREAPAACPQVDPIWPKKTTPELDAMDAFFASDAFRNLSIAHLSGAVQVKSESFDDLGPVGEDARWDVFYDFAAFLETTYPGVHATLTRERVNTHGLLFTWNGSDPALKPTLLMAHQDTVPVPVATLDQWTYPPWSGFFDGKYVWGRGAADCKTQLTAVLDAVEMLVAHGFQPRRTLLLSFGFDEEASGAQGAGHLGPFLLERYGPSSLAVLVDEGSGFDRKWGNTLFALPAVGEKGYIDFEISVRVDGGHSSVPPAHTAIGILSEVVAALENGHQYEPWLDDANPYLGQLQCGAENVASFPKKLKGLLKGRSASSSKPGKVDKLAEEAAKQDLPTRYLMQTSLAVDIVYGGTKINALPEEASVRVNHRVNIGERPAQVLGKTLGVLGPVATKHGLALVHRPFRNATDDKLAHAITITTLQGELEPAPVTPTDTNGLTPYSLLAGTTRALYGEDVVVAPGSTTGNTDTRYYWDLTPHIFRYGVGFDEDMLSSGVHTVNERQTIAGHILGTRWMSNFVRIVDESELP